MDHDRDGYLHRSTAQADPLNLLPSPVLFKGLTYADLNSNSQTSLQRSVSDYGLFALRSALAPAALSVVFVGVNPITFAATIAVSPSTTYTLAVWIKASAATAAQIDIRAYNAGSLIAASALFTPTTAWVKRTLTFTTAVGQTSVAFGVVKLVTDSYTVTVDTAGWMMVAGTSAPTAFNSGSPLHWRDNITSYIRALSFGDGMRAAYEGIAQPARLLLQLNNSGGEWLPENAASPFYNTLKKGMLVRVEAELSGTVYPLWQGTISSVAISTDDSNPIATITAEDPMLLLLDSTYTPQLLQNVTTGAALQSMFDKGVIAYPYPGDFGIIGATGYGRIETDFRFFANWITDFDGGQTTLPYVGDNTARDAAGVGAQAYIGDIVAAELGGRFAFDARRGLFVFHDRHHDATNTPTSTTIQRADLSSADYVWGDDVVNDLTVGYVPRRVGSPATPIYTMPNLPIRIAPGQKRTINAAYRIGDAGGAVGGISMIMPVAGTDYTAVNEDGNATPSSSGARLGTTDYTAYVGISVTFAAQSAQVTLTNNASVPIYITAFQLRGTPLIADQQAQAHAVDATSIGDNGLHRMNVQLAALADGDLAQQYADYLVQRYSTPIGRFASLTLAAHKSDAVMASALALGFGDYVSISDAYLQNTQQHYVIIGRQHEFDIGNGRHNCTLYLQPVARQNWFILNDPLSAFNSSVLAL